MIKMTSGWRRLATWAGVIAPALFVGTFLMEGWLRPGYDPIQMYISALSLGPRGWIQITNFLVLGALFLVFTRAVAAEFPSGKASRGGVIVLTIIGFCYFISGPFVMDPTGTPLSAATVHGTIHGIAGGIVFTLMPVSCFVFLRRFRADVDWRWLQGWTLGLGTLSAAAVIVQTFASKLPQLQSIFVDWLGLIQRTALVPFMLWIFIFALGMVRRLPEEA